MQQNKILQTNVVCMKQASVRDIWVVPEIVLKIVPKIVPKIALKIVYTIVHTVSSASVRDIWVQTDTDYKFCVCQLPEM